MAFGFVLAPLRVTVVRRLRIRVGIFGVCGNRRFGNNPYLTAFDSSSKSSSLLDWLVAGRRRGDGVAIFVLFCGGDDDGDDSLISFSVLLPLLSSIVARRILTMAISLAARSLPPMMPLHTNS